jgi:uncharacterized membrane protein
MSLEVKSVSFVGVVFSWVMMVNNEIILILVLGCIDSNSYKGRLKVGIHDNRTSTGINIMSAPTVNILWDCRSLFGLVLRNGKLVPTFWTKY